MELCTSYTPKRPPPAADLSKGCFFSFHLMWQFEWFCSFLSLFLMFVIAETKTSPTPTGSTLPEDEKRSLLLSQSTKPKTETSKEKEKKLVHKKFFTSLHLLRIFTKMWIKESSFVLFFRQILRNSFIYLWINHFGSLNFSNSLFKVEGENTFIHFQLHYTLLHSKEILSEFFCCVFEIDNKLKTLGRLHWFITLYWNSISKNIVENWYKNFVSSHLFCFLTKKTYVRKVNWTVVKRRVFHEFQFTDFWMLNYATLNPYLSITNTRLKKFVLCV